MRNRNGDDYFFRKVSEDIYTIEGTLKYWRYGGNDGEDYVDYNNLGFVDPSGGPFIARGATIEGRRIARIFTKDDKIYFEMQN